MRKLVVCNNTSLDAYYSGPGGDVMALPMEMAFDAYYVERMRAADTILLGATSYQGFMGFWPAQVDNPDATDEQKEVGRIYREIDKVVISDRLTPDQVAPWGETTTIVPRSEAESHVAGLRKQTGRDILTFASRTTWKPLLRAGLVDEIHLLVGGAVLAAGTPLFDAPVSGLSLVDHRRIGANAVLVSYAIADNS
jgi:dihydrofolate reductase